MQVLLLRAELETPISGTSPLHADGLLSAVHRGQSTLTRASSIDDIVRIGDLRHPSRFLAVAHHLGHQIPLCSAARIDGELCRETLVRRKDARDIESLARKHDRGTGPGRDQMIPVPLRAASTVEWLCVGRRRDILSLCRNLHSLGSQRRHGWGVVKGWECEETDEEFSLVQDGIAIRHLPADWCVSSDRSDVGCVEPPYWHSSMYVRRVPVGSRCTLTTEAYDAVDAVLASL